jgi:hypothetical protein
VINQADIQRLITNAPLVDMEAVFLLLARVWAEGYEAGVSDGCDDVLVVDQSNNPYLPLAGGGGGNRRA